MNTRPLLAALLTTATVFVLTEPAIAAERAATDQPVLARFEAIVLNLADSWGEAGACTTSPVETVCFRTEADMDVYLDQHRPDAPLTCASALRLYRGVVGSGQVLNLSTQWTTLNLANYGFDNDTSSYRVGACSAELADGNDGSGAYPGDTGAYASADYMLSGWDNRISSVYIY